LLQLLHIIWSIPLWKDNSRVSSNWFSFPTINTVPKHFWSAPMCTDAQRNVRYWTTAHII
jgi:hypothetical protein